MKTAGIIAEYNPFHNGHEKHIEATKAAGADAVVCVMSTYFVQRGEPAVMPPSLRTEAALKNGADLVIALPTPWACAGAQTFARGAVGLIEAVGCVDMLSFGSECADIKLLKDTALAIDDYAVSQGIKNNMLQGFSFAAARQSAVAELSAETAQVLSNPNDTLAVEYIRALELSDSKIKPFAVCREGAGHDSEDAQDGTASASFIRNMIKSDGDYSALMPPSAAEILQRSLTEKNAPADISRLETAVLAYLRTMSPQDIAKLPDISEGLENRIYSAVKSAVSLDGLYSLIKTKRYSHARIRRAVMSAFLGITAQDSRGIPPYIRVLGFTDRGREVLRTMKSTAELPIVMRTADISSLDSKAKNIFSIETRAADLYALALPRIKPCGMEQTQEIVMI